MEPIRRFSPGNYAAALESWSFLDLSGKQPLFTSPFGDLFFQSEDGFWFLDLLAGELSRHWQTESEFSNSLNSPNGQDEYLMIGLASEAERTGMRPSEDEVYNFRVLPALGGAVEVSNVELCDFIVAVNLAAQIHHQIKDLPPGTPISGISLN
ncbi:protein of unknown function [Arthrobacter sp. ov407]|uniref:T6SS immunity protein Tdi1 domain-containing protein n=1 Tax=Arthrobacter sp. ov407 TaxID=1761748 RepID=UPI00087E696A|nr:T6SS immunity protein Tdi1 domain-containing protein [Arthrobacter sp. ov407]SDL25507.1 protein of unknown function [Arthrobacter sp. ov407]